MIRELFHKVSSNQKIQKTEISLPDTERRKMDDFNFNSRNSIKKKKCASF